MAEETQKPAPAREAAKETVVAAEKTVKAVDSEKAEKEEPLERRTAQDFEVGGEEEAFLSGGIPAGDAYQQWEDTVDKLRSEHADQLTAEYEEQRAPRTADKD
jgi:hypothetical protein